MQLIVQIHSFCGQTPDDNAQRAFDNFPIILGRSNNCDYILRDDSKYISSNHAVVTISGSELLIQDTSTNGVYINGSDEPLGNGKSAKLRNGDLVEIGDYVLRLQAIKHGEDPFDAAFGSDENSDNRESLYEYHTPPEMEFDWTPGSDKNPESGDWDLSNEQDPVDNRGRANIDWPDWDRPKSKRPPADNSSGTRQKPEPIKKPIPNNSVGAPQSPVPQGTIDSDRLIQALLKGAGLKRSQLHSINEERFMLEVGILVHQAVEGIMQLLKSRNELKNTIRSDVTTIAQTNNNPLKFSQDVDDALEKLLVKQQRGFLSSQQAMQQAVEDLNLHQLAMLDGMKAAVNSLLMQFDPDELEDKLEETNPIAAAIPINREAKLWGLFQDRFSDIKEEALSDFNEVFGREFRKAYERRIGSKGRRPDF